MNTFSHADATGLVCPRPFCPLNRVKAGMVVRIKGLCATPEIVQRLREIGLGEEQLIKLLTCHTNIICQVCTARLAISLPLAEVIWVEPLPELKAA
jgi:Fe2+ transport system protein FeoA